MKNGSYIYRWTTPDGKRHAIYAPTLDELREKEETVLVNQHEGLRADVNNLTVNKVYLLWKDLKRGIKDSTMKNYMYMYETFVMPTFGRKRVTKVRKSDVRQFYNRLVDDHIMKVATIDSIHNVLHQVFQVAVDDDLIRHNPTDNMLRELRLTHAGEEEKRKALTIKQQELLSLCVSPICRRILLLSVRTFVFFFTILVTFPCFAVDEAAAPVMLLC